MYSRCCQEPRLVTAHLKTAASISPGAVIQILGSMQAYRAPLWNWETETVKACGVLKQKSSFVECLGPQTTDRQASMASCIFLDVCEELESFCFL